MFRRIVSAFSANNPLAFPEAIAQRPAPGRKVSDHPTNWQLWYPRNMTAQQVVNILRSSRGGDLWQLAGLLDVMLDSWPMLKKCQHELRTAVSQATFKVTPYTEHGKKPTKLAQDKADLVSKAMRSMKPNPATDEKGWEGMVYDLANAYLMGISVIELQWANRDGDRMPRAATFVHPSHIVFDNFGRIAIASANGGKTIPFDPDSFLSSQFQSQSGSVLGSGMIRSVGWWWSALLQSQEWMFSGAQQHGSPYELITVAMSLWNNTAELDKLQDVMENAGNNRRLMVPEGTTADVKPPGSLGPDNPQRYIKEQADKEVQMLFLGQDSSTTATPGKLGNDDAKTGVLDSHKEAVTKWVVTDGVRQFACAVLRKNYGDDEECPTITADFTKQETKLEAAQRWQIISTTAKNIGAPIIAEEFYSETDTTMPEEGDQVLLNGKAGTLGEMSNPIQPNPTLEEQVNEQAAMQEAMGGGQQVQARHVMANTPVGHEFRGNQWTHGVVGEGHLKLRHSKIENESDKAILVRHETDDGMRSAWFPKTHASTDEAGNVHASPWIIQQKESDEDARNKYDPKHTAHRILTGDAPPPLTHEQQAERDNATHEAWQKADERVQKAQERRHAAKEKRDEAKPDKDRERRHAQAKSIEDIHLPSAHRDLDRVKLIPGASKAVAKAEARIADLHSQIAMLKKEPVQSSYFYFPLSRIAANTPVGHEFRGNQFTGGIGGGELRDKLKKDYDLRDVEAVREIKAATGREFDPAHHHSPEETVKIHHAVDAKFDFVGEQPALTEAHAARAEWHDQAAQHTKRGDHAAADYAKWRGSDHAEKERGLGYSPRELGHPHNTAEPRASELAVGFGGSGQSAFTPVHELVKPSGAPTSRFWDLWRDTGHSSAHGKKALVNAGMIPTKNAEGDWKVSFTKSNQPTKAREFYVPRSRIAANGLNGDHDVKKKESDSEMMAALIAFALALELDFSPLALDLRDDVERGLDGSATLFNALPELMAATHASHVMLNILATEYAKGIGVLHENAPVTEAAKVFQAVENSGALAEAVNDLPSARAALAERAVLVTKLAKAHVVQGIKDALDAKPDAAREVLAEQAAKLDDLKEAAPVKQAVEVNAQLAKGYGKFTVQQTPAHLAAFPFQELYRQENRHEWRPWPARWTEQGGTFVDAIPSDYAEGKMVAPVNSNIWQDLADYPDGTGNPYAPLAFSSGMGLLPVSQEDAAKWGLIGKHRVEVEPRKVDFNEKLTFPATFAPEVAAELEESFAKITQPA